MKVTNPEVIKNGEDELIDAITADVDWGAIEKIFMERHKLSIEEDVEYKNGDIVVYDNQVAYQLEFDIKVTLSVLLDRKGNYISMSSSTDLETTDENDDLNVSAVSAQDQDGDENILDEVLSGPRDDKVQKNAAVINASSGKKNSGSDDGSETEPKSGESKEQKKPELSVA